MFLSYSFCAILLFTLWSSKIFHCLKVGSVPCLEGNWWFLIWPPGIVSIVDGSYSGWPMAMICQFEEQSHDGWISWRCIGIFDWSFNNWRYFESKLSLASGILIIELIAHSNRNPASIISKHFLCTYLYSMDWRHVSANMLLVLQSLHSRDVSVPGRSFRIFYWARYYRLCQIYFLI